MDGRRKDGKEKFNTTQATPWCLQYNVSLAPKPTCKSNPPYQRISAELAENPCKWNVKVLRLEGGHADTKESFSKSGSKAESWPYLQRKIVKPP